MRNISILEEQDLNLVDIYLESVGLEINELNRKTGFRNTRDLSAQIKEQIEFLRSQLNNVDDDEEEFEEYDQPSEPNPINPLIPNIDPKMLAILGVFLI